MNWPLVLLCILWRVPPLAAEQMTVPWTASPISQSKNNNPVHLSTPATVYTRHTNNIWPLQSMLVVASSTNSSEEEVSILLSFRALITGDPSGALDGWNNGSSPCSWQGISCGTDGLVSAVNLSGLELSGTLSPSLPLLPRLSSLDLSDNLLAGPLPPYLCNQSTLSLTNLFLKNNSFSGTIPRSIGKCTLLTSILLYSNSLSGQIPHELGSLSNLEMLALSFNELTGGLPIPILSNCTKLTILALSVNLLTGPLPAEIGKLKNVQNLWLDHNDFSGGLPLELGNLTQLAILQLDSNNFTGPIPPSLGQLTSLTVLLSLSMNNLSGPIPPQLGNLHNLTIITLRGNYLNGTIPAELGNLQAVQGLYLEENMLEGTIPAELANCTSLEELRLDSNRLTGSIPDDLGRLQHLTLLHMHNNNLSGSIPADIGDCSNLLLLSLSFNKLTGDIPERFRGLEALQSLDLSRNSLSGEIPSFLANLTQLQYIDLSYNNFTGPIPTSGVFARMNASSFQGNPGLCGPPLTRACPEVASVLGQSIPKSWSLKVPFKLLTAILSPFFVCGALFLMLLGLSKLSEYGESTRVRTKGDVYSFSVVMLEMLTRTNNMFGSMGVSLPMWVRSACPDRVCKILDPQLLDREHVVIDNDEAIKP